MLVIFVLLFIILLRKRRVFFQKDVEQNCEKEGIKIMKFEIAFGYCEYHSFSIFLCVSKTNSVKKIAETQKRLIIDKTVADLILWNIFK